MALATAACADGPATRTRRVTVSMVVVALADVPADPHDVYRRLHLLSTRKIRPHQASLDGAFGIFNNVVWTDLGPCDPEGFEQLRLELRQRGSTIRVTSVDRFPRMTDYVVPSGVRIADADRVRLGAHLGPGTTVMHEGFVNFNAGTLGAAMIEGRISAGVVVGDRTDIGGRLRSWARCRVAVEVIRIGEGSLVGANAGVGISLGDGCIIEAVLYVTAGMRVALPDGKVIKAGQLSGRDGLLFRRNSRSGAVEVIERQGDWGSLNQALHTNE